MSIMEGWSLYLFAKFDILEINLKYAMSQNNALHHKQCDFLTQHYLQLLLSCIQS